MENFIFSHEERKKAVNRKIPIHSRKIINEFKSIFYDYGNSE